MIYFKKTIFAASLILMGCSEQTPTPDDLITALAPYCGSAFGGKLVSTEEVDASFAEADIVMHVRVCEEDEVRIPLHVDDNRSRTWIVSRTETGLRLKHDHRHEDGHEDDVTQYGGDSLGVNGGAIAAFPADDFSKMMFDAADIPDSKLNTWVMEVDGQTFAYQMSRPNRLFRLEFDLSNPVQTPPPAWGYE